MSFFNKPNKNEQPREPITIPGAKRQGMIITWINDEGIYKDFQINVGSKTLCVEPGKHRSLLKELKSVLEMHHYAWREGEPNPLVPDTRHTRLNQIEKDTLGAAWGNVRTELNFIGCIAINNFDFYRLIEDKVIAFDESEYLLPNKVYIGQKELQKIARINDISQLERFNVKIWDWWVEFVPTEESLLFVTRIKE